MGNRAQSIQDELANIREHIASLVKSLEEKPDYGLGKGDPALTRWELDRVLLQNKRERAANLERALSRMDHGTYGVCEQCGSAIHPDRVAILPDVRVCIRCARSKSRA